MNDISVHTPALGLLIVLLLYVLVTLPVWVATLVWVYRDAERCRKSGILVALLVGLVMWPVGLLVWLILRGDYLRAAGLAAGGSPPPPVPPPPRACPRCGVRCRRAWRRGFVRPACCTRAWRNRSRRVRWPLRRRPSRRLRRIFRNWSLSVCSVAAGWAPSTRPASRHWTGSWR